MLKESSRCRRYRQGLLSPARFFTRFLRKSSSRAQKTTTETRQVCDEVWVDSSRRNLQSSPGRKSLRQPRRIEGLVLKTMSLSPRRLRSSEVAFSHPVLNQSCPDPLSYRSLPTSPPCHCGRFPLHPATAPFPVLERRWGWWGRYAVGWGIGGMTEEENKKMREAEAAKEGARMSEGLRDARRGRAGSRLMFMKQME